MKFDFFLGDKLNYYIYDFIKDNNEKYDLNYIIICFFLINVYYFTNSVNTMIKYALHLLFYKNYTKSIVHNVNGRSKNVRTNYNAFLLAVIANLS